MGINIEIKKAAKLKKISVFLSRDGKKYSNADEYYNPMGHNVGRVEGSDKNEQGGKN